MSRKSVVLQRALVQGRGGVVHGEGQRARGAGGRRRPAGTCRGPARSGRPGLKRAIEKRPRVTTSAGSRASSWRVRNGAQAAISSGSGSRFSGGRHFTTFVMKTSSRDQPIDASSSVEQRPGLAHEGPALPVFVEARALAHEEDLRCGRPFARDGLRSGLVQPAARADRHLRRDGIERRLALGLGHDASPAPLGAARRDRALTQPRSTSTSAISTAFVAAPLRRLSLTTQKASPRSTDGSVRTRPT